MLNSIKVMITQTMYPGLIFVVIFLGGAGIAMAGSFTDDSDDLVSQGLDDPEVGNFNAPGRGNGRGNGNIIDDDNDDDGGVVVDSCFPGCGGADTAREERECMQSCCQTLGGNYPGFGSSCTFPPPPAPSSITGSCDAAGNISVTWTDVSTADDYAFRLRNNDAGIEIVSDRRSITSFSSPPQGSLGTPYTTWVHSCDTGNGCNWNDAVFDTFSCPNSPPPPSISGPLTIEISAPPLVPRGREVEVTWNTGGNSDCTLSGHPAVVGVDVDTGSPMTMTIQAQTTVQINCAAGESDSATIYVLPTQSET